MQGRVDLNAAQPPPFAMTSVTPSQEVDDYCSELLSGVECTPLARAFFSRANVERLHDAIRYGVYKASQGQHVIDRQSNAELLIIMRATFFMQAGAELAALNEAVLVYAVPRILREIEMYLEYKRQAGTMQTPMERSQIATMKGTKTLEMKEF
jgi:hypothetical protein